MTVDNTSSVPQNEGKRTVFKQKEMTNADSFPQPIWSPPNSKKAVIDDIIITLRERSTNLAHFALQIFKDGTWEDIHYFGLETDGFYCFSHAFAGKLNTDVGDGTARIRIRKFGSSTTTNFLLKILVIGRLSS